MSVFALGLNHTTAPLEMRGRFAFAPEQLGPTLHALRARMQRALPEVALLSTCNRTELYVAADHGQSRGLVGPTLDWLAGHGGVPGDALRAHTYVLEHREAARHAFRVAAGLDSMVLGEPQILGQMKQTGNYALVRSQEMAAAAPAALEALPGAPPCATGEPDTPPAGVRRSD